MKPLSLLSRTLLTAAIIVIGGTLPALAQGGNPGQAVGQALSKLFGTSASLSTDADLEMLGDQKMTMEMSMAFHQGKTRTEIDMAKMQGPGMPPGAGEQMKAMGMDRMVSITDEKTSTTTLVFPSAKAYIPMPTPSAGQPSGEPKIEETSLGKETIDGRELLKQNVTVTDSTGKVTALKVWRAAKGEFPVQVEFNEGGAQARVKFKNVVKKTPAESLFTVPKDYEKFDNPQAMIMKRMTEKAGQ